jgi:hypothetical protein
MPKGNFRLCENSNFSEKEGAKRDKSENYERKSQLDASAPSLRNKIYI